MSITKKTNKYVLGIDAGGTYFKSVLINSENEVIHSSSRKLKVIDDRDSILSCYSTLISEAVGLARDAGGTLVGVGVSTPGPFDYHATVSLMRHKLKSIYGINLEEALRERGVLDGLEFCCMHDGLAFLYGEYIIGEGKGYSNVAAITLGTGTGFSLIKDGVLCETPSGNPAFSIYKDPLEDKTVEDFLSARGIPQTYKGVSKTDGEYTPYDIEKLARESSDEAAIKTYGKTGRLIAEATKKILAEK